MYLIGLCGRSGSGKSLVCTFLKQKGVYIIDADLVCREVYASSSECISELSERFGADIVTDNGIDRNLLGKRAFQSKESLDMLNAISHKFIISAILNEKQSAFTNGYKYVVVDAPTLFESSLNEHCDAIVSVFSCKRMLYSRLRNRENISNEAFQKRYKAQKTNKFLVSNSDAVIKNAGSLKELKRNTHKAFLLLQIKLGEYKREKEHRRYVCKKYI